MSRCGSFGVFWRAGRAVVALGLAFLFLLIVVSNGPALAAKKAGQTDQPLESSVWRWQNPFPASDTPGELTCPAANICYAADYNGNILKTSDGGASWQVQSLGSFRYAEGITCPTALLCFVPGSSGAIARTTDGGDSWYQYNFDQPYYLYRISCPTSQTCYGVGNQNLIVKTTNGGQDWTVLTYNTSYIGLDAIACSSLQHCIAGGDNGTLLTTDDGGASWTSRDSGTTMLVRDLACPTNQTCYATVYGSNAALKTTDGGASWATTGAAAYTLEAIDCASLTSCLGVTYPGAIVRTGDGGASWTTQNSGVNVPLTAVACRSEQACLAAGFYGTLLKNDNIANPDWQKISRGMHGDLSDITCPGAATCYAVSLAGEVLNTTNAGNSWAAQTITPAVILRGLACTDTTTCYAVGNDATGNGSRFLKLSLGAVTSSSLVTDTTVSLSAIACPASQTCYIGGNIGTILKTSDGGASWTTQNYNSNYQYSIARLVCPTVLRCYAEGNVSAYHNNSTEILATSDGGAHWNIELHQSSKILNGLSCFDELHCLAVGGYSENAPPPPDTSFVLATSDGINWTLLSLSGLNQALQDINCPQGGTTCYAIGGMTIFKTHDRGQSWQGEPVNALLSRLACPTAARCLGAGGGGAILARTLVVDSNEDNGTGTQEGSFSYALANAIAGETVLLKPASGTITLDGQLPPLPAGVALQGDCQSGQPGVELHGSPATPGLQLTGQDSLYGLKISGFNGPALKLSGGGNRLSCVVISKRG